MKNVFPEGMRVIKPGGHYTLVGLVHPNSQLDVTAEQIIRKCLTFRGMLVGTETVHFYTTVSD